MAEFERNPNGRYKSNTLTSREFVQLFSQISKQDEKKRRLFARKNLLTPSMLRNKDLDEMLDLGKKKDGLYYTRDDLIGFEKKRNTTRVRFDHKTAGIPYAQLIASCRKIDVDRANNQVSDGRGITNATFVAFKKNTAIIKVKASSISADENHQVLLRFEEWDQAVENITGNNREDRLILKSLAAGRVSIQCDCGRFKYWYRYIATAGNFIVSPPKEYIYPKEKNPNAYGTACKHIIHAAGRMQVMSWHVFLQRELLKQSKSNAYGDDKRVTTTYFSEEDQKKANRNRKSYTNQADVRANYKRYKQRLKAFEQVRASDDTKELLKELKTAKKANTRQLERLREESEARKLAEMQLKEERQLKRDQEKVEKVAFIDLLRSMGKSLKEAETAWDDFKKGNTKK